MSIPTKTSLWQLNHKPENDPDLDPKSSTSTFKLTSQDLPSLSSGSLLIRVRYVQNDPAQRGWIDPNIDAKRLYRPPVEIGETMNALGLGEVVDSKSEKFKQGDWVIGGFGWSEYVVKKDEELRPAKELPGGLSRTHYLGALGSTGLTAYYGIAKVVETKKEDAVLISGAAGATGSMVVQVAKNIIGAKYVVGIAGSDEKCKWVESLGADKCLNYKSPTFEQDLKDAAKDGFDVFFDNVGGEILDQTLTLMNKNGRVAVCGAVSGYNSGNTWTSKNYFQIISMTLTLKGFIVLDYLNHAGEVVEIYTQALKDGKIKLGEENETVVDTKFEDIPQTWSRLFKGANQGKLITKLV